MRFARLFATAGLALTVLVTPTTASAAPIHGGPTVHSDFVGGPALTSTADPGIDATSIAGGQTFYTVSGRCTIGFNVRNATYYYFLTSARCVGAVGTTVYADLAHTVVLGVVSGRNFSYDYAIVRYTNTTITKLGSVYLYNGAYQDITTAGTGYVGQVVKSSGPVSGVRSGSITALNATVYYADGIVYGLIRTNICTEAGESGSPLFAGTTAIGILSGGSGNCTSGGTTYYASVTRALSEYGVTIY